MGRKDLDEVRGHTENSGKHMFLKKHLINLLDNVVTKLKIYLKLI